MDRLKDKVAVITGGSSGLGRATALLFAEEGAKVVVGDVNVEGGRETAELVQQAGGDALFVETDVTNSADVQRMVQAAVDAYGRVDVLFNNAGIDGEVAITHEASEENWDRVVDVNMKAVFLGMKHGIAQMLEQGGGAIINTSSCVAEHGWAGLPAYSAAKAGVLTLTKIAAVEYGDKNIRINAIKPGLMMTDLSRRANEERESGGTIEGVADVDPLVRLGNQNPTRRGSDPKEVAYAALFLASDEASYVHGVVLPVDGGWTAKLSEEA
jgi:NAD(P)-dependent dehydrogenase (short-subunit alcohol dehydrogenase family)